ncbi:hypothetical protein CGCSCA4_v012814 [Colletotrichum siamense]|uniref:Uncharacterized protein n=1 Tax=Colletotrichum siamense TaxID=690259 RepID=A0A9P5BWI9_COLSI|nr:hypothetical protein CGCSCA4_v012814 [Colletotrichum siamense]KAF4848234.1 hypothetical protein CGCSCA2_v012441 [Colletotrichum siamense]
MFPLSSRQLLLQAPAQARPVSSRAQPGQVRSGAPSRSTSIYLVPPPHLPFLLILVLIPLINQPFIHQPNQLPKVPLPPPP